jgi:prophage antirepressor-like protein
MQNAIQVFNFQESEVRTITNLNNEVYFVASDVCKILDIANTSDAISRLDQDEKSTIVLNEYGRDYEKPILTESGFYSLVLGSRKPEAKAFKKWVTSEVLPAIRKTGTYSTKNDLSQFTTLLAEHKTLLSQQSEMINVLLKNLSNQQPQPQSLPTQKSIMMPQSNVDKFVDKYLVATPKNVNIGLTCTEITNKINSLTNQNFTTKKVGLSLRRNFECLRVSRNSKVEQIYFVAFNQLALC